MPDTYAEHLAWCKRRAHDELNSGRDGVTSAWASMVSDLSKHDGTRGHVAIELGMMLLSAGKLSTKEEMAKFIDGFA
jgi:hypothetical protein